MAGIICKWLNYEVQLSKYIDYGSIGLDFCNGVMFGQIFWKYGILDNLNDFADFQDDESVRRNYNLLEPLWDHIGVQTSDDLIKDVQKAKAQSTIELLYKLFVSLESQKCHVKEDNVPRAMNIQHDRALALNEIHQSIQQSVEACWRLQEMISTREVELNVKLTERQDRMKKMLEGRTQRIAEQIQKFTTSTKNETQIVEPTYKKMKHYIKERQASKKKQEVESTYADIERFEEKFKHPSLYRKPLLEDVCILLKPRLEKRIGLQRKKFPYGRASDAVDKHKVHECDKANEAYLTRIRNQMSDELELRLARKQRKMKIIQEQLQIFQGTEREEIEDIMVDVLLRQSKFEKKIINELMQIRKEKAVILESRRLYAKQLGDMREKEFADSLEADQRHAEATRFRETKQIKRDWGFHKLLLTKHAEQCYQKHFSFCWEIVIQIIDLSICVSHHLRLTGNKIPPRLWREWKTLFISTKPVFCEIVESEQLDGPWEVNVEDIQKEEERLNAMDEADFQDYKHHVHDWTIPDDCDVEQNKMQRSILGHIVHVILNQMYPFPPPLRIPQYPQAPIRMCILGKPFAGKTQLSEKVVDALSSMSFKIIHAHTALDEALQAYRDCEDIIMSLEIETEMFATDPTSDLTDSVLNFSTSASSGIPFEPLSAKNKYMLTGGSLMDDIKSTSTITQTDALSFNGSSGETGQGTDDDASTRELTPLAVLGYLAWNTLKNGLELEDNITVRIILEIMRQLPEMTSCIIDGFPVNLQQAKLLEQGLSAYYTPEDLYLLHTAEGKEPNIYQLRSSNLVPDPDPPEVDPPPKSSFDMVVYLDADDEAILSKASIHNVATDVELDFTQLTTHQHILKFNEDWPYIQTWFQNSGVLRTIPVIFNEDTDNTQMMAEVIVVWIQNILIEKTKLKEFREESRQTTLGSIQNVSFLQQNDKAVQFPTPTQSMLALRLTDDKIPQMMNIRLAAGDDESENYQNMSDGLTFNGMESDVQFTSDNFSAASLSLEDSPSKQEAEVPSLEVSLSEMLPAQPGDANWEFVKCPIPQELASVMCSLWQNMEIGYITAFKASFRKLRQYQNCIIRTYHTIQEQFIQFLQRPDKKQEFVSCWQSDYNAIARDMRADDETKAELHMRVDDLRHVLWEICDQRLEESKTELSRMVISSWLDDWLVLLSNRYLCLMQAETDRFFDTFHFITDYYDGMEGILMQDFSQDQAIRVPLINMNFDDENSEVKVHHGSESMEPSDFTSRQMNINTVPQTPSIKGMKFSNPMSDHPPKMISELGGFYKPDSCEELIYRTYNMALTAVENQLETVKKQQLDEMEMIGKDKKSSKIKVKGIFVQEEILANLAPEVMQIVTKQSAESREKIHLEYFFAVDEEACRVKTNLQLISYAAMLKLDEMKKHSLRVYDNLDRLTSKRFETEMESVEVVCKLLGYGIEEERRLPEEIVLSDDQFFINGDIILFPPTPDHTSKMGEDVTSDDEFSVKQIREMSRQFFEVAPNGFLPAYQFENIINDIIAKENELEILPDDWKRLNPQHIHELIEYLTNGREFLNWRMFLLYVLKPWIQPTEVQLVETLDRFHDIDVENIGVINKVQYEMVDLWFKIDPEIASGTSTLSQRFYSRFLHVKDLIFDIFNISHDEPSVDYFDLLCYFTADVDPIVGFTKALSLGCNFPILTEIASAETSGVKPKFITQSLRPDPIVSSKQTRKSLELPLMPSIRPRIDSITSSRSMLSIMDQSPNEECPIPFSVVFQALQYAQPTSIQTSRLVTSSAEKLLGELECIFTELGSFDCETVSYSKLIENSVLQHKIKDTTFFGELDIYNFVRNLFEREMSATENHETSK